MITASRSTEHLLIRSLCSPNVVEILHLKIIHMLRESYALPGFYPAKPIYVLLDRCPSGILISINYSGLHAEQVMRCGTPEAMQKMVL